ncbi:putative nuclease HARBI1 [Prorops nasuta]|uniref:putative nuclease HARBI1 n=1 Tax=Prorops nasuta TaxID=863751 RepID=UPI0034CF7C71
MDWANIYDILFHEDDDVSDNFSHLTRERHIRINEYYENVICHYSISGKLKLFIFHHIGPCLLRRANCPKQYPPIQLAVTLWILGNQEVYRSVSDRFNLSKDTIWKCVFNVSYVLQNHVKDYIKWPNNRELLENEVKFKEMSNFPGVVGVIDGCHIRISSPIDNPNNYINRKGIHSIVLQGICDYRRKFIDVFTGYCGSVHDARVWQLSDIKQLIDNNQNLYFPRTTHLLGDTAYSLSKILLVPFKDNGHLNEIQINYNKKLSATRITIERTFGLLKCRFRKLKYVYMYNVDMIPLIILTCCVLQNICIDHDEEQFEDEQFSADMEGEYDVDLNQYEDTFLNAQEKRDIIAHLLN